MTITDTAQSDLKTGGSSPSSARSSTPSSRPTSCRRSIPPSSSTTEVDGEARRSLAEVAQQIGDSRVRAICLRPTDGLTRGTAGPQHRPWHPRAGRRPGSATCST